MADYFWSDEAEKLAGGVIVQFHPHLANLKIAYLMKPKKVEEAEETGVPELNKRKRGRPRTKPMKMWIAKAALLSSRYQAILAKDYRFVIVVNQELWDALSLEQQVAVMDHELCHCVVDTDTGKCAIRKHDLEEFRAVVTRHGFYLADVQAFAEACLKKAGGANG
jgi:hypothetical protein